MIEPQGRPDQTSQDDGNGGLPDVLDVGPTSASSVLVANVSSRTSPLSLSRSSPPSTTTQYVQRVVLDAFAAHFERAFCVLNS